MNKIISILKSIKFWTIIGTIASLITLYYAFVDREDKDVLSLSIGNRFIKAENEIIVVNIVCGWEVGSPLLLPMPFGISNLSNKTIDNISINYFTTQSELDKFGIVNQLVTPNEKLSPLYIQDGNGLKPFENGGGVYIPQITPKTAMGASNTGGNIYFALLMPEIDDNNVFRIANLPFFKLQLKGDNCKDKFYNVRFLLAFSRTTDEKTSEVLKNVTQSILNTYKNNTIIFAFQNLDNNNKELFEIKRLPFFKLTVDPIKCVICDKKEK